MNKSPGIKFIEVPKNEVKINNFMCSRIKNKPKFTKILIKIKK